MANTSADLQQSLNLGGSRSDLLQLAGCGKPGVLRRSIYEGLIEDFTNFTTVDAPSRMSCRILEVEQRDEEEMR